MKHNIAIDRLIPLHAPMDELNGVDRYNYFEIDEHVSIICLLKINSLCLNNIVQLYFIVLY